MHESADNDDEAEDIDGDSDDDMSTLLYGFIV